MQGSVRQHESVFIKMRSDAGNVSFLSQENDRTPGGLEHRSFSRTAVSIGLDHGQVPGHKCQRFGLSGLDFSQACDRAPAACVGNEMKPAQAFNRQNLALFDETGCSGPQTGQATGCA